MEQLLTGSTETTTTASCPSGNGSEHSASDSNTPSGLKEWIDELSSEYTKLDLPKVAEKWMRLCRERGHAMTREWFVGFLKREQPEKQPSKPKSNIPKKFRDIVECYREGYARLGIDVEERFEWAKDTADEDDRKFTDDFLDDYLNEDLRSSGELKAREDLESEFVDTWVAEAQKLKTKPTCGPKKIYSDRNRLRREAGGGMRLSRALCRGRRFTLSLGTRRRSSSERRLEQRQR